MDNKQTLIRLTNQLNEQLFSSAENRNTKFAIDTAKAIVHLVKEESKKEANKTIINN